MARTATRKIAREARPPAPSVSAEYRIADYPMHYIAAVQRQNQLNFGRVLRDFGLSVPMWRALAALHGKDTQTIGEIADTTVLDRSSLGRLLDEMAGEGLVERTDLPDDRRAVLIRLSAAGKKRFEAALPFVREHYRHLLRGFDDQEFATLMRFLRRLKANARMMADATTLETE
jgi:MarR family transcriptional regulator, organic hydroperoxide resistance regulator